MTLKVELTNRAHAEVGEAYAWWTAHRSPELALRWYDAFCEAMNSLSSDAERFSWSRENGRFKYELRDRYFGIGRRKSYRIVFAIQGDLVLILAIRHLAQRDLTTDDLA